MFLLLIGKTVYILQKICLGIFIIACGCPVWHISKLEKYTYEHNQWPPQNYDIRAYHISHCELKCYYKFRFLCFQPGLFQHTTVPKSYPKIQLILSKMFWFMGRDIKFPDWKIIQLCLVSRNAVTKVLFVKLSDKDSSYFTKKKYIRILWIACIPDIDKMCVWFKILCWKR